MASEATPQERARMAGLIEHPRDRAACGGCIFYAPRDDGDGYCAHPTLKLDVGAGWWCAYYENNTSTVSVAGHPLHPALIPFPLALTAMALVFDVVSLRTGQPGWRQEAKHALIAGTVGGLLAAPSGMMDWLSLPAGRPAKSYGLIHGLGNVLLLGINALNISLRSGKGTPSTAQQMGEVGLSASANILALITGWLGGQLSYRFSVGVEPPTRPYRALDIQPIARLTEKSEWRGGHLRIPAEPVWRGPEIPSQPLPSAHEERRAAS